MPRALLCSQSRTVQHMFAVLCAVQELGNGLNSFVAKIPFKDFSCNSYKVTISKIQALALQKSNERKPLPADQLALLADKRTHKVRGKAKHGCRCVYTSYMHSMLAKGSCQGNMIFCPLSLASRTTGPLRFGSDCRARPWARTIRSTQIQVESSTGRCPLDLRYVSLSI